MAVLADINAELIGTYRELRDRPTEVISALSKLKKGKSAYYRVRSLHSESVSQPEQAARFIFLNRFCFNGLYRTNRAGKFNVPYGGVRCGKLPSVEQLQVASSLLRAATLISGDFEEVLETAERGDFVYMDPPYVVSGKRVFNEYSPTLFDASRLPAVRRAMKRLKKRGVSFLVSYAYCPEAVSLMEGFRSERVTVQRNIAGFAHKRRTAQEVLIFSGEL
jgi:DNA adenine methylase